MSFFYFQDRLAQLFMSYALRRRLSALKIKTMESTTVTNEVKVEQYWQPAEFTVSKDCTWTNDTDEVDFNKLNA